MLAEEAKSDITSPGMTKAFNQLSINKASSMNFYIQHYLHGWGQDKILMTSNMNRTAFDIMVFFKILIRPNLHEELFFI